ncbi:MAG: HDIG domain-containing protein [Dehalococcoidia bacterium]|nr:HDIG domain-containing protein [Dehalococcoidia bacterium]
MSRRTAVRPVQPAAPGQQPALGRNAMVAFAVLVAAALFATLFPWFPGGIQFAEGSSVDRAILSPRERSYESEVLTEQVREDAAEAVDDVFVLDTDIREQQLRELDRLIAEIEAVRGTDTLSTSAKESQVRAVPGSNLSERGAATAIATSGPTWSALTDEARTSLGRALTGTIRADDVDAARQRAAGLLSALLTSDQHLTVTELVDPLIVPTLVVDQERTNLLRDEARANTLPVRVTYQRGEVVVPPGQPLSAANIEALQEFGIRESGISPSAIAATAVLSALVGAGMAAYLAVARPPALRGTRRLLLFALFLIVPAAVAKFSLPLLLPDLDRHFLAAALPLAAGPMAAAVLLEVGSAIALTVLLAAVVVFVTAYLPAVDSVGEAAQLETVRLGLVVIAASIAGITFTARADRLQRYLVAGMVAAGATALVLLATWFMDADRRLADFLWIGAASLVGGVLAALVAVGSFVLLSRPFGIITRVELMELAQLTHPLLRRLQDEAPGTFQHSILVGNLAERAADRIGADPLLVRVGAYYHDAGKLVAPEFFVENTPAGAPNPHDGLDPLQSTRVIQQHVTGGVEIARRERLPEAVVQFIPQHHGTRLVAYFYRRAAQSDPDIEEDLFRYPGPKPQSRETALVMLADSCEATVRASADRSAGRIREIIDATIKERIEEGQFDECDLSLRDLAIVADSYTSTLTAVFHPRVEYPEPSQRELAARRTVPLPERAGELREAARRSLAPRPSELPQRPVADEDDGDDSLIPPSRERPAPSAPRSGQRELSEDDT